MKIFYISDFFLEDLPFCGGAEYNDKQLVEILREHDKEVIFARSSEVTVATIKNNIDSLFIVSNFLMLDKNCVDLLTKDCSYIIYEHDHKYLKSRNPVLYKNFKAPVNQIINKSFYESAKFVFCQSSFHEKIINKNLNLKNTFNISGNLWSEKDLSFIKSLAEKADKKDCCSIMDSKIWNKNTVGGIEFCDTKNIKYELISDQNYHEFLKKIAANNKFLFLPRSPETLSRVCVEAKMLGCSLIVNNLIGAKYEEWFKKDSGDLIEYMQGIKDKIINKIEE